MIRALSYLYILGLGVFVPLMACAGRSRPPESRPDPTVATTSSSSSAPAPPASVEGPMVAFHDDQMTTRVVTSWLATDQAAAGAGAVFTGANTFGTNVSFPRAKVLAKLNEFPVDLNAALERIEVLSQKVFFARKAKMEELLALREKKAQPGSTLGARGDLSYVYVQLSADRGTMTFSSWWTLAKNIEGPLVKVAPQKCAPGQPCNQRADYRPHGSVSITAGARYVLTREGALTEEVVFAPRGDG